MPDTRVRIAPSPTGEDLHIGNVYTALLNYIFAKKMDGKFIVRIEDTDRQRLVKGSEEKILSSLRWFGLNYDEGPDIGGPYGPYRQSERKDLYLHYAEKLVGLGYAYYCFCTPEDLERMRGEQQKKGLPTLYDGRCKRNQQSAISDQNKKGKYVIRLNVPDKGITEFHDVIRGKISFENNLIDDQILIKSDGFPTYHMAVVVDDHLMGISHVIRAEDWISSTPKHVLIYKYLGWPIPVFAHGPLLRNPDKSKLSKRKNPVWASWYRNEGFLPEAILNYLALMGWSMPDEREMFSLDELIKNFKLEDLKSVGPAFDLKKLEWLNGEYIRRNQRSEIRDQIYTYLEKKYPRDLIGKTIPLIQERIKKYADYLPLAGFFFKRPQEYEINLASYRRIFTDILQRLEKIEKWKAEIIGEKMQEVSKQMGMKNSEFFMVLRVSVTGKKISPPLNDSMEILGKEETLERIRKLI